MGMTNINPLLESNGKIKAVYINLETEKDKKLLMEAKLNKLDFCNFRRFNAIVGKNVYNKLLQEDKIYKNIPLQLIMEDDCMFHEKFKKKFYQVLDMIKDKEFDIFYLGYIGDKPIFNKELHILNNGCPRGSHSYILTLNGAKKLVDKISRLNYPIDEI